MNVLDKKTTLEILDNDRHYYPILTGQQKEMSFKLKNTGKHPLMITDIITSCGCLKVNGDDKAFSVPVGKERLLTLSYNSAKNVGYVKHYVAMYGNFENGPLHEIVFDINVVPNALYTQDYEELYKQEVEAHGGVKRLVDGDESEKGYYMADDLKKAIYQSD
ncbi:DUF1573 domain-containing protein [Sphingobacterium sp. KU25419]|nr:DUF1573 domain-containing protein [Sphingobacterium sp. KU25419]